MSLSALVLAGGSGTRFWPASRRLRPKQFLALDGDRSMLQATVARLAPLVPPERVWISTTAALAAEVAEQLPEIDPERILIEPAGRNTAPAIAWSVRSLPPAVREGAIAVLPSDHRIADAGAFRSTLAAAAEEAARRDRILALGVVPRHPEVGFGYLETGGGVAGVPGLLAVSRFTEKPDLATAERFVASGRHFWNAGMFVFRGTTLLARLEIHAPELARGVEALARRTEALAREGRDAAELGDLYRALPSISIDYALMEKLDDLVTLPLDCGWNDLGSWDALAAVLAADDRGNSARGGAVVIDGARNLTWAEEGTIAVLGLSDLIVVRSGEAVLVAPRAMAQDVRRIVDALATAGRDELL